jgi:7,8-dihydropterin-6-yl-methyl-4-(beta-D-ribofuranosyl)aminobenzene 5'-phosphate synthase
MRLTIVYDNEVFTKGIGLKSDWGFSCLITTSQDTILFDTGANGTILLDNMKKLTINPNTITKIVLSHDHHDHTGGLNALTPFLQEITMYHLKNIVLPKKIKLSIPETPEKINENLWTTGRIKGITDEQALLLKSDKGWYVLTGCSHPGVKKILHVAKQVGPVVGIIGGFHQFHNFRALTDLDFICPCHCTAYKEDLQITFPGKISRCGVGKIIDLCTHHC